MERVKSPKFSRPIYTCGDGLRFATPELVARYRAGRLKTGILADISCGIGGQTVFFAKKSGSVYGIDVDGEKLECARKNAEVFGVDNITFIKGDALSPFVIEQIADADIIFSDPTRPPTEAVRRTESLRPAIPQVFDAYREVTDQFAFEAPPQLPPGRIDFDCECEYISVDGQLNRLTLYFGPLKQCDRSAVVLSEGTVNTLHSTDGPFIYEADELKTYAFEPDPAVVKAGLLGELAADLKFDVGLIGIDARRSLLTSEHLQESPFFKNRYMMLDTVPYDCNRINRSLKEHRVGRAIIRFSIPPGKYWEVRNRIEKGLAGEGTVHIYRISGQVYLLEMLK